MGDAELVKRPWIGAAGVMILAVTIYLIFEYITVLQRQPDDWYDRVRAVLLTLAAVIGLPFLAWRTVIADRQNQINRESQNTEVFGKAVELLGTSRPDETGKAVPVVETRVGAIFALERLSKTSQADYEGIVETLSAYVREQCGMPSTFDYQGKDPDEEGITLEEKSRRIRDWTKELQHWILRLKQNSVGNRGDIAAALLVLSRRSEGRLWKRPFSEEGIESGLRGANLQGARIWEIGEGLANEPGILGAHLEAAVLDGSCLEGSNFVGFRVENELTATRLVPRSLVGISSLGFTLKNARIFPVLDGSILDLAQMADANCKEARFRGARLVRATFARAKLNNAKFSVANASYASFDWAELEEVEFMNALLEGASFTGANLTRGGFQYAILYGAKFDGALVADTDFSEARYLDLETIDRSFGTLGTKLPQGLPRPSHWSDAATAIDKWKSFKASNELNVGP